MPPKYGFPYRGSKSKIALDVINVLPGADNLYDLFAGGCAITHCAILSNKWNNVIANDIQNTTSLFLDATGGKYKDEKRWISREDFFRLKDVEPYVRWIWSFGNNGRDYLFGKDIEQVKRSAHRFLFENEYDRTPQSRVKLTKRFKEMATIDGRFELEQLERLQQLETYSTDYRDVEIKSDSVVYCDIPYNQKKGVKEEYHGLAFDTDAFYEWAGTRDFPVYFSSCFCEDFECVWQKDKLCTMNNKNSHGKKLIIERLFWNGKGEHIRQTLPL